MDWVLGIITIIALELTLRKRWEGWLLTLFNQCFWLYYIFVTMQWGFLLINAAMWVQSVRGIIKWRKDDWDALPDDQKEVHLAAARIRAKHRGTGRR